MTSPSATPRRLVMNCWGGLGNQMFEYAAGLYLAQRTGRALEAVRPLAKNEHWNGYARPFQLEEFCILHHPRQPAPLDRLFLSTNPRLKGLASLLSPVLGARTVQEPVTYNFHPDLLDDSTEKTLFLNGFWQSAGYPDSMQAEVRQQYRFRAQASGRNAEYAASIAAIACPISLHLRIGDYAIITHTGASGAKMSMVLRREYYTAAIAHVRSRFPQHTLVVFSDDQPAARQLLASEPNCLFIEGNDAASAHEDMRLMSLCRHHIIANSSFSWWGAWLNPRQDKQVFAPKFWGNTPQSFYPDLYPSGWTPIDNLT